MVKRITLTKKEQELWCEFYDHFRRSKANNQKDKRRYAIRNANIGIELIRKHGKI